MSDIASALKGTELARRGVAATGVDKAVWWFIEGRGLTNNGAPIDPALKQRTDLVVVDDSSRVRPMDLAKYAQDLGVKVEVVLTPPAPDPNKPCDTRRCQGPRTQSHANMIILSKDQFDEFVAKTKANEAVPGKQGSLESQPSADAPSQAVALASQERTTSRSV